MFILLNSSRLLLVNKYQLMDSISEIPSVPEQGFGLYVPIAQQLENLNLLEVDDEAKREIRVLAEDAFQTDSLLHRSAVAHAIHRAIRKTDLLVPDYKFHEKSYYSYEDADRHEARRSQVTALVKDFLMNVSSNRVVMAEVAAGSGKLGENVWEMIGDLRKTPGKQDMNFVYSPSDLSRSSLSMLAEKKFDPIVSSATELPYGDDSVDILYAGEVIEHLLYPDFGKMLGEVKRVLKKNGLLILTTPNYFSLPARNDLRSGLKPMVFDESRDPWAAEHLTPFTKESLVDILKRENFLINTVSTNQVTWKIENGEAVYSETFDSPSGDKITDSIVSIGDSLIVSVKKID